MLHLIAWLGIYSLTLLVLGRLTRGWHQRRWFKVAFLPGTLLASALQTVASLLCFSSPGKLSPFADGRPAFAITEPRIAYVPGGFFLVIIHGLLYALFLTVTPPLERAGVIDSHCVTLPSLYPLELLEGRMEIDLSDCVGDPGPWKAACRERPAAVMLFFYGAVSVFAALGVSGKVWRRATFVLAAIGSAAYAGTWLGAGFKLFGRGWWASIFYFPDWWALFSLFVTLELLTLLVFAAARACQLAWRLVAPPPPAPGPAKRPAPRRSARTPRGRRNLTVPASPAR